MTYSHGIKSWWGKRTLLLGLWRAHSLPVFLRIIHYYLKAELTGEWEPWLWGMVPRKGRRAIDAGANKGQWAFKLAKRFNMVVAIEPHPATAQRLRRSAPDNVQVVQGAVWNTPDYKTLILYPDDRICRIVNHDLLFSMGEGQNGITVACFTIDALELRDVDFLKLDVEGAEAEALEGALATIKASAPVILIELHSVQARERIEGLLVSLDYTWQFKHYPFYNPGDKLDALRLWMVATPMLK